MNALDAGDLCEAFAATVQNRGDRPALRSSDGTTTLTWREFDTLMRQVAGGLAALGVRRGGTVLMLLTNRYEAAVVDMATLHLGAVPLSVYNSSPVNQLTYLFGDSGADVVVTEDSMAAKARAAIAALSSPPTMVVLDDGLAQLCTAEPLPTGTRPELSPHDLLTVVYTSGTTGEPKGAELSHYNVLEQIRGLHSLGRLPDGGSALSYLPFAHMADRLCAYYMPVVTGATITYHPDPRTAADLLPQLQPTLYMAVPRIWQRLRAAAEARIDGAVADAVRLGGQLHDARVAGIPRDEDLHRRWRAHEPELAALRTSIGMGSGVLLFTGAAPLPPDTLRFFAAIGIDLCECYGQSETAGIILCNPADRPRPLTNGLPLPGVEATLAPDGELLLRGPMVMSGYRNKPELTADAFDADGWLLTGDIFTTDEAGYYRIVDRKREILVTSTGKNISPVHVENTVAGASPLVGSVVGIGDARPYVTALIVVEPDAAASITGSRDDTAHPAVVTALTSAIRRANRSLSSPEQVRRFSVLPGPWAPGSDELTATMKLRRVSISTKYAAAIEALYGPPTDTVIDVVPRQE